jgi:hypothetical protein
VVKQCAVGAVHPSWGVRSLSLNDHLLTAGTGQGGVSFLDLRTMAYLPVGPVETSEGSAGEDSRSRIRVRVYVFISCMLQCLAA